MNKTCILCSNYDVELIDVVYAKDLEDLYRKELGIDIRFGSPEEQYLRNFDHDLDLDEPGLGLYKCNNCDLRFFDPAFSGDEQLYQELQEFPWYYQFDKYEYGYVALNIKPDDRVLEIGCGRGAFSKMIETKEYVGLEFNKRAAEVGQSEGIDIRAETLEKHSIYHENHYDVVASFQVLEHVVDPWCFIHDAERCLKPGGLLILSTPAESGWLQSMQDFPLNLPPHHVTRWTDQCFEKTAGGFDLELVDLHHEPMDPYHLKWAFTSAVARKINDRLGVKHSLISGPRHWIGRAIAHLSFHLSSSEGRRKTLIENNAAQGHTVIATYRKK